MAKGHTWTTVASLVAATIWLSTGPAAATDRYHGVVTGGVVVIGNTLGLSKQSSANGPGTADSIGTFIAAGAATADTTPANPGNPWFAGTTSDWHSDASSAQLTLPAGAVVQYAELV